MKRYVLRRLALAVLGAASSYYIAYHYRDIAMRVWQGLAGEGAAPRRPARLVVPAEVVDLIPAALRSSHQMPPLHSPLRHNLERGYDNFRFAFRRA